MDPVDTRRIATTLNTLANERQKALKPISGKKKPTIPKLAASKGVKGELDVTNYDDGESHCLVVIIRQLKKSILTQIVHINSFE